MKNAFVVTVSGALASAVIPNRERSALNLGDRIVTRRPLDLGYVGIIGAGQMGTVDFVDPKTGLHEILMDVFHKGLFPWDNHMWLEPFGTLDIEDGVEVYASALKIHMCA